MKIVVDGLTYAVVVTSDGAAEALRMLSREPAGRIFVVADEAVAQPARALREHLARESLEIAGETFVRAGEKYKRWPSVEALHRAFLDAGLDRDGIIVAVGGGTLTDVAGFAAATYLRGIRWLVVGTTLLAMVDAAIGGKTGINTHAGKNLAGAFWQPLGVIADVSTLATLSKNALREGVAEIVKVAVIGSGDLMERVLKAEKSFGAAQWSEIVASAAAVKVREVARDPYDRGSRAKLNLGHTFAHGIERASNYRVRHGAAVALGLRAAGVLARDRTGWSFKEHRSVMKALARFGLRLRLSRVGPKDIIDAMKVDKKRKAGTQRFVLPVHLGEVETDVEIPDDAVLRALTELEVAPHKQVW